jgi:hypothetical protein
MTRLAAEVRLIVLLEEANKERSGGRCGVRSRGGGGGVRAVEGTRTVRPSALPPAERALGGCGPPSGASSAKRWVGEE